MATFVYELHDSYGASRTIELDLPFDGEWKQGHGVPNGSLAAGGLHDLFKCRLSRSFSI